jgi:hypothetical protein
VGVVVVAAVAVAIVLLTRDSTDGPYALATWEYGAIAWVEPAPADLAERASEATRLFEGVFELWGFEPPNAVEDGRVARKSDPAGGAAVDLRAMQWEAALLPPLVVVVVPDADALEAATGVRQDPVTIVYGVPPQPHVLDEDPTPILAAEWLVDLTGASIAFACSAERWQERLVEATAEWMLERALEIPEICDCTPYGLPELVGNGIGGYSVSRLLGGIDRIAVAKDYAVVHGLPTVADTSPLAFDVDAETRLSLGTSFIAYLVEEHGTDGLVEAICDWHSGGTRGYCMRSASRTLVYLKGWRVFLGLEEQ